MIGEGRNELEAGIQGSLPVGNVRPKQLPSDHVSVGVLWMCLSKLLCLTICYILYHLLALYF
jgi:cytochrome oxidase assembly protein ShyY1